MLFRNFDDGVFVTRYHTLDKIFLKLWIHRLLG